MDYKKVFENKKDQNIFIKTVVKPPVNSGRKAALNRMANNLFNSGDIEGARRIYLTTGYSDGLIRVGDYYKSKGRLLDALRMYWIAPDRKKAEPIITQIALVIQNLLEEGENRNE
jgi:myo-inositol-1-phosphate synthase